MKKKITIFTLAAALIFSAVIWQKGEHSANAAAASFPDIKGHWAEQSIKEAVAKGYVNGYPDGTFGPNNTLSRAEFVKMIVAALGIKVSDNAGGAWYKPYFDAATAEGIYVNGDFASNDFNKAMPRVEMSKVGVRALGEKNVQAKEWMYRATKQGLIHGTAPGVLSPDGTTTRAQAITVIERILSVKDGKKLPVDKYAVSAAELYWHKTNIFSVAPEMFDRPENYKQGVTNGGMNSWKESLLTLTTPDGKYKGEVEQLVVIDMADPKDPNRKLLPPIKELSWASFSTIQKLQEVSDDYIILLKTKDIFNKDTKLYGKGLRIMFGGFVEDETGKTKNSPQQLVHGEESLNAYIVSKSKYSVDRSGSLRINIEAPGKPGAPFTNETIVRSYFDK
ncbi:S-layer homology domain-containing protein [Paenibacillus rubinfantis]|uniref:S-layer homology domain-containing protein n=1 Tax=Paenibacillus rubinfantis TaxID=1720296 RepID=UPI00073E7D27|nr:S-layer homology domain-containing protein [Paenibacillus rubinfantis]